MAALPPSSDSLQSNSSSHKQIQSSGPADHQGLAEQRGEEEMGRRLLLPEFLFTTFSSLS